jgi:hypothetical protein
VPHGVRIAVVAPAGVRSQIAAGLAHGAPGAFRVVASPTAQAAADAVRDQSVRGAFILEGSHHARILTAGGSGVTLEKVVEGALTRVASATHVTASVRDVAPLSAADANGLLAFVLGLGLLIPSVIGSVGLYLVGRRSRLWLRAGASALFAIIVGGLATLVIAAGFGAFSGFWLPVWGIATLGAAAFVLSVAAAQATVGLPGTGLMALLFIFVGNAVSGGSVPTEMLPAVYRQISPWLPNGGVVHAIRSVVSFHGHGLGQPLLALALWTGGAVLVLLANDLLHRLEGRRTPERLPEIYATPGVAHAAAMSRRRRAG